MTNRQREARVQDDALEDLLGLVDDYNAKSEDKGEQLATLLFEKLDGLLVDVPAAFAAHPKEPTLRVYGLLPRFPVRIVYRFDDESVTVVAVEHMRALPDKWRGRLRVLEHDDE